MAGTGLENGIPNGAPPATPGAADIPAEGANGAAGAAEAPKKQVRRVGAKPPIDRNICVKLILFIFF